MRCIVLFMKLPVPSKVKTRLTTHLSETEAASLHEVFVHDTLHKISKMEGLDKYVACHPDKEDPFFRGLETSYDVKTFNQTGGDLGTRMKRAFQDLKKEGYKDIIIIGSDSPTLPAKYIEDAFNRLRDCNTVIGPSLDGGYYLIGISEDVPELFDDVNWGTDTVFEETLMRAADENVEISLLPYWYDVDTINDLRYLMIHLDALDEKVNSATRRLLKDLKTKIIYPHINS